MIGNSGNWRRESEALISLDVDAAGVGLFVNVDSLVHFALDDKPSWSQNSIQCARVYSDRQGKR
jgi:hypothetical protein